MRAFAMMLPRHVFAAAAPCRYAIYMAIRCCPLMPLRYAMICYDATAHAIVTASRCHAYFAVTHAVTQPLVIRRVSTSREYHTIQATHNKEPRSSMRYAL